MPTIPKLPTFELPKLPFDLPELPRLDLPELPAPPTAQQVADATRDAVYLGIGLTVMTAERLHAAGTQVADLVTTGVERLRAAATN